MQEREDTSGRLSAESARPAASILSVLSPGAVHDEHSKGLSGPQGAPEKDTVFD